MSEKWQLATTKAHGERMTGTILDRPTGGSYQMYSNVYAVRWAKQRMKKKKQKQKLYKFRKRMRIKMVYHNHKQHTCENICYHFH